MKSSIICQRLIIRYLHQIVSMDSGSFATRTHHVFVYGTLKKGEPNYKLLLDPANGSSRFLGAAVTKKKWPLVIASRFNIPFLLHCEGTGHNIHGELYGVDDAMLKKMDELECHPKYYERLEEGILLKPDNGSPTVQMEVWIYFMRNYKPSLLELPLMDSYSSLGSHGLPYVENEDTSDPEDIYD